MPLVYAYNFDTSIFWNPIIKSKISSDVSDIFGHSASEMKTSEFRPDIRGLGASFHWRVSNFGFGVEYDYTYTKGGGIDNVANVGGNQQIINNLGKYAIWVAYAQTPEQTIPLLGDNTQIDVSHPEYSGFTNINETSFDNMSHYFIVTDSKVIEPTMMNNGYNDMQIGYSISNVSKQFFGLNVDWAMEFGYTIPFIELSPGFVNSEIEVNEVVSRVCISDGNINELELNNAESIMLKYTTLGFQFGIGAKQRISKILYLLASADGMYLLKNQIVQDAKNPVLPNVGIGMSDDNNAKIVITSIFDLNLKFGISFLF